jgi:hypothetical protein
MAAQLTIPDFIARVKLHNEREIQWRTEKETILRELSILLGQKAAIDLVKYELQERIHSFQRSLGLPVVIDFPPRPIAPPIETEETPAPETPAPVELVPAEPEKPVEAPEPKKAAKRPVKKPSRRAGKVVVVPAADAAAYSYAPKHEVSVHLDSVRALCFYESHPFLVSGSDDGTIRVTNLEGKVTVARKIVRRPVCVASLRAHRGPVLCLVGFERNGEQMMVSGGLDSVICVWALPGPGSGLYEVHGIVTHHRVREIRVHEEAVWSIDVLEDQRTGISAAGDGLVKSWQIDTAVGVDVEVADFGVCVKALLGKQFAVGCRSGHVRLFDGLAPTSVISAGSAPILRIACGAESGQLLTVCDDNFVRVIDVLEMIVTNELDGHENGLTGICVTPDGEFLITTGNDASMNVWRAGEFIRVDNVKLHSTKYGEGALCCAPASPKCGKTCFATGGAEGTVQVFVKG